CRRYRDSGITPGILQRWRRPFGGKNHLARDAPNGQVALDSQLSVPNKADARGLERRRRELLHVQEVLALQVRVALSIASFDRGCFDQGLDTRVCRSDSSRVRTPVTLANCPFTLEIIMCLTLNSATEWAGSMFHVVVAVCGIASVLVLVLSFLLALDAL